MEKITVTIDLSKLDKSRIVERTYTNKEGQEVTVKQYRLDVVPTKEENFKEIASGDTWRVVKKYFVTDSPTKEERQNKVKTNIIGDGTVMEDQSDTKTNVEAPW